MYFVLQFPFADMRGFMGGESARLTRPSWPLPSVRRDFVRSSGRVYPRYRGGNSEWPGEDVYADASLALRFPDGLGQFPIGPRSQPTYIEKAFRRFYSDGVSARLEVGARLETWSELRRIVRVKVPRDYPRFGTPHDIVGGHRIGPDYTQSQWLALFTEFLELPVRIGMRGDPALKVKLVEAGDRLARHYLHATTRRQPGAPAKLPRWRFSSGNPTLLIEYPYGLEIDAVLHTRFVLQDIAAGVSVLHSWIQLGGQRCSTWFIATTSRGHDDARRRLRIHLLRLHAERECLRLVLECLNEDKLELTSHAERSDLVQLYLNDAIGLLEKKKRYGVLQSELLNTAHEAMGIALEGQVAALSAMRRQVAAKVRGYLRTAVTPAKVINNIFGDQVNTNIQMGNISVTGDFNLVTAKNIENSFNKGQAANVSDDLKACLQTLAVEVAKLAKQLPPDAAESASKDLASLTSEAVSSKPREAWYQLSANGLLEAAKTIAEMTGPVTTAVKAVLALLAP